MHTSHGSVLQTSSPSVPHTRAKAATNEFTSKEREHDRVKTEHVRKEGHKKREPKEALKDVTGCLMSYVQCFRLMAVRLIFRMFGDLQSFLSSTNDFPTIQLRKVIFYV